MPTAGSIIFYDSGGNLSEDNSNLFWDNTNKRIGIGTASPDKRLTIVVPSGVNDVARFRSDNASSDLIIGAVAANIPAIYTPSGQGLSIGTNATNDRIRITSTGLVGINTNSPDARLHVIVPSGTNDIAHFRSDNGGTDIIIGVAAANIASIYTLSGQGLSFGTNGGTERMRITSDGVVIIGTNTPTGSGYSSTIAKTFTKVDSSFERAIHGETSAVGFATGSNIGVFGMASGGAASGGASFGVFGRTTSYVDGSSSVPAGVFGECDKLGIWTQIEIWVASTAKSVGNYVRPTASNGHKYKCTTAGTTGSTQPTWPTGSGATVSDGSVIWTEDGSDDRNFVAHAGEFDNWTINVNSAAVRAVLKTNTAAGRAIWASCSPTGSGYAGYFEGILNISKRGGENAILEMATNTADPASSSVGKLYVKSGALYYRGTSGTITKLADA